MIEKLNLTMLTDFYEMTMANGYFCTDMAEDIAYFDMFFRKIPDDGGYAVMAGLEQVIRYLDGLEFTEEDIEYLRSLLEKQKEGKKKMRQLGSVSLPSEAFTAVLKLDE